MTWSDCMFTMVRDITNSLPGKRRTLTEIWPLWDLVASLFFCYASHLFCYLYMNAQYSRVLYVIGIRRLFITASKTIYNYCSGERKKCMYDKLGNYVEILTQKPAVGCWLSYQQQVQILISVMLSLNALSFKERGEFSVVMQSGTTPPPNPFHCSLQKILSQFE